HGWSGKNAGHWHKQEDTMKSNVSFLTAMQTAMRNIQIHSGFIVHQCAHRDDTADYIAMLTQQMVQLISFKDLQLQNTKGPKTIGELWLHMLAQLPGISSVAAECIASIYPTPFILFQALQKIRSEDERINLFKSIRIGSKVMSLKVAKSLADFFE
ncbi:MAG: hypothetical protein EZS28_035097, partial [Streblomastix strix]